VHKHHNVLLTKRRTECKQLNSLMSVCHTAHAVLRSQEPDAASWCGPQWGAGVIREWR